MLNMCELAVKLPKYLILLEFECFYLVIQVGSTDLNDSFGLVRAFVAWGSKLTYTIKPF